MLQAVNISAQIDKVKSYSVAGATAIANIFKKGGEKAAQALVVGSVIVGAPGQQGGELLAGAMLDALQDVPNVIPKTEKTIANAIKAVKAIAATGGATAGIVKYGERLITSAESKIGPLEALNVFRYMAGFPPVLVFFKERETTLVDLLLRLLIETLDTIDESKVSEFKTYHIRRMLKYLIEQDYYVNDDDVAESDQTKGDQDEAPRASQPPSKNIEQLLDMFKKDREDIIFGQTDEKPAGKRKAGAKGKGKTGSVLVKNILAKVRKPLAPKPKPEKKKKPAKVD